MRRFASTLLSLAASAGLFLAATVSPGQAPTDYPTLKGTNARTGANADPRNSSPGFLRIAGTDALGNTVASSLQWFRTAGGTFDISVDNTDDGDVNQVDSSGTIVGPFDPQPFGGVTRFPAVANLSTRVTGGLNPAAGWAVANEDNEAQFLYTPSRRATIVTVGATTYARDFNPRFAGYEFTNSTPSAPGKDPRIAAIPAQRKSFTWTLASPDTTPRNLALYTWLPIGTTTVGGVQRVQQRYFVYEITYGTGQTYVDVVDTDQAGAGFVRLGNGGRPTDQVFPFAGINPATGVAYPVTVRLYNTIPRDSAGNLTQTAVDSNGLPRLVYADAVRFTNSTGSIFSTPTAAGFGSVTDLRVIAARNDSGLLAYPGSDIFTRPTSTFRASVTSHDFGSGAERWTYVPDANAADNVTLDNDTAAYNPSVGFATAVRRDVPNPTNAPNTYGPDYLRGTAITGEVTLTDRTDATESVLIDPGITALPVDRQYELTMFTSGPDPTAQSDFARTVQYEIFEGATSAGIFTLDEAATTGFVRLGVRKYDHSVAAPLTVRFYNTSPLPADAGRQITVDAVRFTGAVGNAIASTPVHARAYVRVADTATPPAETNVVLVADQQGRISCLDANGNGDGTTKVYWTYPSTATSTGLDTDGTPNYKDPNTNVGLGANDGNGQYDGTNNTVQAEMPTGFDLSTAVVVRQTLTQGVGTIDRDFLIVGGSNGRVYCIAMEGRGDLTATGPGTTFRRWTYPDTFPSTAATASRFGQITSVVTGDIAGETRVFFGTGLGRFFAVDAVGTDNSEFGAVTRTTTRDWQYPGSTVQPLPSIVGAPALDVANGRVFFGTLQQDDAASHLLCLDADTGTVLWNAIGPDLGSWRSGPAYVPATELNNVDLTANQTVAVGASPDMLFAMNENGSIYGLNANTGATIWRDTELQSGGLGSLGYVRLVTQDRTGTLGLYPTITVPTEGGRFASLYARLGDETAFATAGDPLGNRIAWGARVGSPIVASISTLGTVGGAEGFLYGASSDGTLYAFSGNTAGGGGGIVNPPISEDVVDNNDDPRYNVFRNAEVGLLSKEGFVRLRQTAAGTTTGLYNSTDVIDTTATPPVALGRLKAPYKTLKTTPAFEWGETIYVILYNFQAPSTNVDGSQISPPVAEVTVTTEGKSSRPISGEARIFADKTESDVDGGYAVVQVPLTSGGNTSLTPGPGLITVSLRTSAGNRNYVQQSISLRPDRSRINYTIANPLAIGVDVNSDAAYQVGTLDAYQLGYTTDAASLDNVNGSPNVTGGTVAARDASKLAQSFLTVQHGQSGRARINVYDRSLMTLLRGEGRGLDNVRVDRRDLAWEGQTASVVKPIVDQLVTGRTLALFGTFEDLPTDFPNVSLDYPDIRRDRVSVTKDPNGAAENPIFGGVALTGPRVGNAFVTDATALSRQLKATPFEFKVDVPKYQPPAFVKDTSAILDSAGTNLPQGYTGRYSVFVDSDGNGAFGGGREAYRSFRLFARVAPDERIVVTTPTVDLGALAAGAGYDPGLGYSTTAPYRNMTINGIVSPWNPTGTPYARLFSGFTVKNEGNVNLLNVRVAKGSSDDTGTGRVVFPWQTFSLLNDETAAWHDARLDVWSDLDRNFAPVWDTTSGNNQVLGQKPRVTDLTGRSVQANPVSRANPNLPGSGNALFTGREPRDPRIGVTIPIGFPIGAYSQTFRVIEDYRAGTPTTNDDELLSLGYQSGGRVDPQESYSDPGVRVAFTVTETQLTGGISGLAPKMVDTGNTVTAAEPSGWSSRQPAAARALNGALAMVFSSDRGIFEPLAGKPAGDQSKYRLFVATLAGGAPGNPDGRSPDSQTRDLNQFLPTSNTAWWGQKVGGYPAATAATLFPNVAGAEGAVDEGSQSFGLPALPVDGFSNPANYGAPGAAGYNAITLAFVGNVNRVGTSGPLTDSRLFATSLGVASNGDATVGDPVAMPYDPTSRKGKPAVVESTNGSGQGATIVYPVTSGNASSLFVTRFQDGAFSKPIPIDLGTAFESAGEPSASIHFSGGTALLDVAFSGRLRGRSGNEIFQIELVIDPATHLPVVPFRFVAYRVRGERAVLDAATGTYRVRGAYLREPYVDRDGVAPDDSYDDGIFLRPAGGAASTTDVRDAATRRTDRESRVESSASPVLGGQVYLDRGAGSIRAVGGVLSRMTDVVVNYDSYVLRLSGNEGNGYGSPTLMRDTRLAPSNTAGYNAYWFLNTGAAAPANDLNTYADRTYALFTRAAQPGGQTVRPFLATTRLGIRLSRPILTNPDGTIAETQPFTVANANGRYQLDPAAGKIYFTRVDEGNVVRITFNGVTEDVPVGIVGERAEQALPLGKAINENNLAAFFDPVFNLPNENFDRRALIWTFWSSTRNGAPNIFSATISPKLVPFVPSQ